MSAYLGHGCRTSDIGTTPVRPPPLSLEERLHLVERFSDDVDLALLLDGLSDESLGAGLRKQWVTWLEKRKVTL